MIKQKNNYVSQFKLYQLLITFSLLLIPVRSKCACITYEFSHGRFGDNLLTYIHAKWLSHVHNIELAYKPFEYSNQLVLHYQEKHVHNFPRKPENIRIAKQNLTIAPNRNCVYTIPYFSDFLHEHQMPCNKNWVYFAVDWQDKIFLKKIKTMISPINAELRNFNIPKDKISVAVHVREGGGFDSPEQFFMNPLKFPPQSYYIDQVKKISEILHHKDIYLFIFTDHKNPSEIMDQFQQQLTDYPHITIDCQHDKNNSKNNTLHDFFSLLKFDCLIRPQSNYSYLAGRLTQYRIEISPRSWSKNQKNIIIDQIEIIQN